MAQQVAKLAGRRVIRVEGDVLVSVDLVSGRAEIAARTIRPKILKLREDFLVPLERVTPKVAALPVSSQSIDIVDIPALISKLNVDRNIGPTRRFKGGTERAKRRLAAFVGPQVFLDELIIRRELAMNFVEHQADYDSYSCLPQWAKDTLHQHRTDHRPHTYSDEQLARAQTHDPYWNAAMKEMRYTGYMHNHMRMYWGKKILEWSSDPEQAFRTALTLNNRYFLCGRDANSYANIAWCFGLHDRPWPERPIFGKVRSMTASGLERKVDIDAYVRRVDVIANVEEADL